VRDLQAEQELESVLRDLRGGRGRAVLVIEPNPDHQSKLARLISVNGHRAIATSTLEGAHSFLRAFPVELVLLAEELCGNNPLRAVAAMVAERPLARILIMVNADPDDSGVRAVRDQALEYVPRPLASRAVAGVLAG